MALEFVEGSHGRHHLTRGEAKKADLLYKPDVNTCSLEELEKILNIGPNRARAIIADREQHGAFESLGDFDTIYGIAEPTVKAIADSTTINGMDWYEYEEKRKSGTLEETEDKSGRGGKARH